MDRFDTRRQQILQVQVALREAAYLIAPGEKELHQELDRAEELVLESAVSLAVIGAEGHGKSTLVDAIIGQDIVPRETQYPGTVAPVIVHWGEAQTPVYRVGLQGRDNALLCEDSNQFRRFLLQRFNPNNERGVVYGTVEYAHLLLADGLRLVDMPGLEGVSATISQTAREAIAEAKAVILVVRDREYAAAARLLREFGDRHDHVQAVISNWSLDFWEARTDKDLDERVHMQKDAIVRYVGGSGSPFRSDQVFVLHLPSISECKISPTASVQRRVHVWEVERFCRWIVHYLDEDRVTSLLRDTTGILGKAQKALLARTGRYRQMLCKLCDGDLATQTNTIKQVNAAYERLLATVNAFLDSKATAAVVAENWYLLSNKIQICRDTLLTAVWKAEASVPASCTWDDAKRVARHLREQTDQAVDAMENAHTDALRSIVEHWREFLNPVILQMFETVPLLPGGLGALNFTVNKLYNIIHETADVDSFLEIFSDRRIVERVIGRYRAQAQALEASMQSTQHQVFLENIQALRRTIITNLEHRCAKSQAAILGGNAVVLEESLSFLKEIQTLLDDVAEELVGLVGG